MSLPIITLTGNLVADPELRFTANGKAVTSLRVASSERRLNKDTNIWEDGDSCFLDVTCWRDAEQVAETISKGTTVSITGHLKQRSYETKEGEKRSVYEVNAEHIAVVIRSKGNAPAIKTAPAVDPWAAQASSDVPF